jgi:CheY-like chemotaxis protein
VERGTIVAPVSPVILIVEDHADSSAMYTEFLAAEGFVSRAVLDAEEAFTVACDLRPDLVVTDVVLPRSSGLELTRRLRRDHRTARIRIIVLTGRAFPRDAYDAYQAGCDCFVTKPCLPDTLAGEIRRVLGYPPRQPYEHALERIRAEYVEMPGMHLKPEQVQRLCGVDADVCRPVLDALVAGGFLCLKADGSYGRLTDGECAAVSSARHNTGRSAR